MTDCSEADSWRGRMPLGRPVSGDWTNGVTLTPAAFYITQGNATITGEHTIEEREIKERGGGVEGGREGWRYIERKTWREEGEREEGKGIGVADERCKSRTDRWRSRTDRWRRKMERR